MWECRSPEEQSKVPTYIPPEPRAFMGPELPEMHNNDAVYQRDIRPSNHNVHNVTADHVRDIERVTQFRGATSSNATNEGGVNRVRGDVVNLSRVSSNDLLDELRSRLNRSR